jgi:hypothetical protein
LIQKEFYYNIQCRDLHHIAATINKSAKTGFKQD